MDQSTHVFTVTEVGKLAGVSVRTLHFYDEIGLLRPAFVGANGYRYYGAEQLTRLQDILFYRELDLPLEAIRALLDAPGYDRLTALKKHRRELETRADRLGALIRTLEKTIQTLEEKTMMPPDEMYEGFDPGKQAEHEAYLVKRFGSCVESAITQAREQPKDWPPSDYARAKEANDELGRECARLLNAGENPAADAVQQAMRRHFALVSTFWTPTRKAYVGLGQLYVEHPEFRQYYEQFAPSMPEFLAEAMKVYAEKNL